MKKLLLLFFAVLALSAARAQGFLGFGTTDLAKKKIESIELVLTGTEKLSPSSTFKLGLVARDKKGKEFKTYGMEGGDYPIEKNYDIAIDNATVSDWGTVTVNPVNMLNGNTLKISIKFKSNPALSAEKEVAINYEGAILVDYSGKKGRDAAYGTGGTNYNDKNPNGQRGQNAGDNAEAGEPGKKVEGFVWVEKVEGVEFLRLVVKDLASGEMRYFQTKAAGARITIDASGGHGGGGGNGGNGGAASKEKGGTGGNGGNGSSGADGGNGGAILLAFDETAKDYQSAFSLTTAGGEGGRRGLGGNGGYGATKGSGGADGQFGRKGMSGPAPVKVVKPSELKWYAKN